MKLLRLMLTLCASLVSVGLAQNDPARSLDYAMARHLDVSPMDCRVFTATVPENAGACYLLSGTLGEILAGIEAAVVTSGFDTAQQWRHVGILRVFDVWEIVIESGSDELRVELFYHRAEDFHIVSVTVLETEHPTSMAYVRLDKELRDLVGALMQPCTAQESLMLDAEPARCYFGLRADSVDGMLTGVDAGFAATGFSTSGDWQLEGESGDLELWVRDVSISNLELIAILLKFELSSGELRGRLQLFTLMPE